MSHRTAVGSLQRIVPRLVPFGIAAGLAVLGWRAAAVVVAALATVVLVVALVSPATATRFDGALARFGRFVGRAVGTILLGLVQLLVFLPVAAVSRLLRRDLLTRGTAGGWQARDEARSRPRRTFGSEQRARVEGRPLTRALSRAPAFIGWTVLAIVGNYAIGWAWDEYVGSHDTVAVADPSPAGIDELRRQATYEDDVWATSYWDEVETLDYQFSPFILSRISDTDGDHVTSRSGVRRSYAAGAEADAEVWFFGGAALWGMGQRDLHTIPSEIARQAEAEDLTLEVRNLAQPGYTSLQSALLLEQELAVRPAPDLVVFYDGADDVSVQLADARDGPTHYNRRGLEVALTGRDSAREQAEDLWEGYRDTSVITRLLGGLFAAQPAAAGGTDAAHVERIHDQSVAMATDLARRYGTDAIFAWQASSGVRGDNGTYRDAAGRDDDAFDLTEVLDDRPEHFLDGVLTDEEGAQIVARALWPLVREGLEGEE